ncbi:DUF2169 domain-containing protein [Paraglaciecola sp.]|uniref:DUF2169 family type VI secretion system accessory protein n=1 Tax=Paraglaciecola sp. TaxID=1920173 RepID=UPI003EF5EC3C
MQQVNNTQFKLAWMPGMLQSPQHSLTLIVKGCFDLVANEKSVFTEDPDASAVMGDLYVGDDPAASLSYANDLIIYKPKADLTLSGLAYPQLGQAGCTVTFGVGEWSKSLATFNDRFWRWGSATAPEPFGAEKNAIPLIYENAFGGSQFSGNPVGKGINKVTTKQGEELQPLPNVEHVNSFVSSPSQKSTPAGFGPLKDNWADKTPVKGTYDDKWLKQHFPYFPKDFDWGYFNTAPQDQQVAYLSGDETLYFANLRPELPQFSSQLPELRPRLFLHGELDGNAFFQEVTLRIDTLHVDMEKQQVNLVWRGVVGVQSDEFEEINHACLYVENMDAPQQPQSYYFDTFQADIAAPDEEHKLEKFEDKDGVDLPIEQPEVELTATAEDNIAVDDSDSDLDKLFEEQFAAIKKQMQKAGMPTELVDNVGVGMDPMAFLNKLTTTYNLDASQGEAVIAKSHQDFKELLTAHGHDPDALNFPNVFGAESAATESKPNEPELIEIPSPEVTEEDLEKGDLSGSNLSHRDLSNRDFKEADLAGADLTGANISGSNFTSADLSKANLTGANAQGAIFDHAILTSVSGNKANFTEISAIEALFQKVKLVKANFTLANLTGADFSQSVLAGSLFNETLLENSLFEKADLSHCRYEAVTAVGASFIQSNLRESFFSNSNLSQTNYGLARLSLASFENSDLTDSVLESVDAHGIHFEECILHNVRAGEQSDFTGAKLSGGNANNGMFSDSILANSIFLNVELHSADFSQTDLTMARFEHCNLKMAEFAKANLSDSKLSGVNLFQASFAKTKLSRADLSMSNLYGAEFHQANLQDTNLKGANIKQTKIELGMVR